MSISVDDLTSSLSSSHIGQEAIELAALQAQLAQTLFGQSISQPSIEQPVSRKLSLTQPCNTPTISSSFTWAHVAELHRQFTPSQNIDTPVPGNRDAAETVEDDEQMVEDVPSLPLPSNRLTSQLLLSPSSVTVPQFTSQPCSEDFSSFTPADPFYIAQPEAARSYSMCSHSAFSQIGLPSQQSPFIVQEPFSHRREINPGPPPLIKCACMSGDNPSHFQHLRKTTDGG